MILQIPVIQNNYDQSVNLQLATKTHTFRFRYNQTEGAWYCYLGLLGEDPKVKFKIVNGIDLLAPWRAYKEIPYGVLFIHDQDLEYGRAGKDNFYTDGRFILIYADITE